MFRTFSDLHLSQPAALITVNSREIRQHQNQIWRNATSSHDTQVYPNQHSKKVKVQTDWPKKFNLSFHESLEQMTKIPIYSLSFSEPQPCDNVDDNNNNDKNDDVFH